MKQVRVQNVTYYIESEDELIDLAHRLVKEGYSVSQIAQFLGVTERKVKKMMEDCWWGRYNDADIKCEISWF